MNDVQLREKIYKHLRSLEYDVHEIPSLKALARIVKGIEQGEPLDSILADELLTSWSKDQVIQTVKDLGDWVRMVKKTSSKDLKYVKAKSSKNVSKTSSVIVLSSGFDDRDQTAELAHAVGQIVQNNPDEQMLRRYIDRTYRSPAPLLTADHVMLLVYFGQTGLWRRLGELTNQDALLAQMLATAWDLLEVYSAAAVDALNKLTTEEAIEGLATQTSTLLTYATQARWLYAHDADRAKEAITAVHNDPENVTLVRLAQARLRGLQKWWLAAPLPVVPDRISVAQAQLLGEAAGLVVNDVVKTRKLRSTVRKKLTAMGLASELDIDLDEGVAAAGHGLLDAFFQSRQARLDGDDAWHANWHSAVANVSQIRTP